MNTLPQAAPDPTDAELILLEDLQDAVLFQKNDEPEAVVLKMTSATGSKFYLMPASEFGPPCRAPDTRCRSIEIQQLQREGVAMRFDMSSGDEASFNVQVLKHKECTDRALIVVNSETQNFALDTNSQEIRRIALYLYASAKKLMAAQN